MEARRHRGARERFLALVALSALAVSAALLAIVDPASAGFFPPCLFHTLTGFDCPGCGSLRGLHQLLRGHPVAAFRFNPLMLLALPFEMYALASWLTRQLTVWSLPRVRVSPASIWVLLAAILLFWVFRNMPFYPLAH
jgi:hypothetical protein